LSNWICPLLAENGTPLSSKLAKTKVPTKHEQNQKVALKESRDMPRHNSMQSRISLYSLSGVGFALPADRFLQENARLTVGAPADIVIYASSPSLDVTAFSRVAYTIKAGRVVFRDANRMAPSAKI
jgi:formylmethanofuran dehydrogenase subunit A